MWEKSVNDMVNESGEDDTTNLLCDFILQRIVPFCHHHIMGENTRGQVDKALIIMTNHFFKAIY